MRQGERTGRPNRMGERVKACGLLCLLSGATACAVPIAGDLDDTEANRVFVALDRANVDATKEPDPVAEGRWRIEVPREDVAQALAALQAEHLPRRPLAGLLDAVGKGSLVPSEEAERAQLTAGIAGELERSLEGIDGVLSARVHLSIPASEPFESATPRTGTASVLIEHRGATPPIAAEVVQRLVAGAVAGIAPADIAVVLVPRSSPPNAASAELSHVGPIAVARSSLHGLQAALAALIAVVAALSGATVVLYARLNKARAELRDAAAAR